MHYICIAGIVLGIVCLCVPQFTLMQHLFLKVIFTTVDR